MYKNVFGVLLEKTVQVQKVVGYILVNYFSRNKNGPRYLLHGPAHQHVMRTKYCVFWSCLDAPARGWDRISDNLVLAGCFMSPPPHYQILLAIFDKNDWRL